MQYELHRSFRYEELHVLIQDGKFYSILPEFIRNLGPWQAIGRGELPNLRLHYRLLLLEQGFIVLHQRQLVLAKVETMA